MKFDTESIRIVQATGLSFLQVGRLKLGLTMTLLAILCLGSPVLASTATENDVQITVRVLDPTTEEAKKLPTASEFNDSRPVVHIVLPEKAASMSVLANSYIVLHGNRRVTFTSDMPDVLDSPARPYVFPSNVQGIFEAKKPGNAVITITYAGPAEICGAVANCSPNWAGYVLSQASQSFTGVTAQWKVPTVAQNSPHGMSSTWVGIDGWGNSTVLQAGTEQDFNPWYDSEGGAIYYAWFELFPNWQTFISVAPFSNVLGSATSNTLLPGDVVQVSIKPILGAATPVAGRPGQWLIEFTDQTQKWTFSTTVNYTGDLSSAEWIEEATSGPSGVQTLANYGQVEFDVKDRVATGGNPLNSPEFVPAEEVSMNQLGLSGSYSTPSNPDGDRDGFFVTYTQGGPNQVFPPGPWIATTVLPPAVVNQSYNQNLSVLQAASPSWTLTGSLPPGLLFNNSEGTISGIPSHTGTFPFSVVATDTSTGEYTQTQSLSIAVRSAPASTLRVDCGETTPSTTPPATFWPQIDGKATQCGVPATLPLGSHSVSATLTGFPGSYKMFYGGSCDDTGHVTLTQGNVAICLISAEATSVIYNGGCQKGEHCCDPSAKGCAKCMPEKTQCP